MFPSWRIFDPDLEVLRAQVSTFHREPVTLAKVSVQLWEG